jgi:hypothetical protein
MESNWFRKARETFEACSSELKELEKSAGITSCELRTFKNHRERARTLYFVISHSDALRKQLISKTRESDRLFLVFEEARLDNLKEKVKNVKYRRDRFWFRDDFWWLVHAATIGVVLVSWGSLFHTEGLLQALSSLYSSAVIWRNVRNYATRSLWTKRNRKCNVNKAL